MFSRTSICAQVLGSHVNRGAGYGLEVPVHFILPYKMRCMGKKIINGVDKTVEARFERCMKNAI